MKEYKRHVHNEKIVRLINLIKKKSIRNLNPMCSEMIPSDHK